MNDDDLFIDILRQLRFYLDPDKINESCTNAHYGIFTIGKQTFQARFGKCEPGWVFQNDMPPAYRLRVLLGIADSIGEFIYKGASKNLYGNVKIVKVDLYTLWLNSAAYKNDPRPKRKRKRKR